MKNDLLLMFYIYFGVLVIPYFIGCILEYIDKKRKEENER